MLAFGFTRLGQPAKPVSKRYEFIPGLVVVRIKKDVVANIPELHRLSTATM